MPCAPLHLRTLRGGGAGASVMFDSVALIIRIEGIGRKKLDVYVGLSRDENIDVREIELRMLVIVNEGVGSIRL